MTVGNRVGRSIHPVVGESYVRLVSGNGVFVTDDTGKEYLDAVAGIGVVALGYGRDDIVDAHERIWDILENYKEVVEALEDTNESVISHRVNDILRVLTSISVIVLPLTLLASIWGMNVGVPGEQSMTAFWVIAGVMVALLVGMVAFFRKRGWL